MASKGKKGTQRKLTAILCADVVGCSLLMGADEESTLHILTESRQVFSDYIEKFRGQIVNAPGDCILAEFASVGAPEPGELWRLPVILPAGFFSR